MKVKRYPRGAAFREACHAVVAWSLGFGGESRSASVTTMRATPQRSAVLICRLSNKLHFAPLVSQLKMPSSVQPTNWRALMIVRKSTSCSKQMRFQKKTNVKRFEVKDTIGPESVWERTWARSSDWRSDLPNAAVLMLPSFCI